MDDIKAYYKKQNDESSSKSSNFQYEEQKKEEDNLNIQDKKQNLLVKKFYDLKESDQEIDDQLQSEGESILDQFDKKGNANQSEEPNADIGIKFNEDLRNLVDLNNEESLSDDKDAENYAENYAELFSKNIEQNFSSGNSPIVDNSRPENSFLKKQGTFVKNSPDAFENIEIPSKPIMRASEKEESIKDEEVTQTPQKEDTSKFEDPQLTPESTREQKNEYEEKGKLIADQILHILL
jgi:hypothetical protein